MSKETMFVCDECGGSEVGSETEPFPYDKGWSYVYNLKWKTCTKLLGKKEVEVRDKHFCSTDCLIKHFTEHIGETRGKKK